MTTKKPFSNYTEQAFSVGWLYGKLPRDKKDAFIGWVLATDPSVYDIHNWLHAHGTIGCLDTDELHAKRELVHRLNWDKFASEIADEIHANDKADNVVLIVCALLLIGAVLWAWMVS